MRRPRTWGECAGSEEPCPWYGCRYHLGVEVTPTGGLRVTDDSRGGYSTVTLAQLRSMSEAEWDTRIGALLAHMDARDTCLLRLASQGPLTLDAIAERLNVTKQRVDQVRAEACVHLERGLRARGCDEAAAEWVAEIERRTTQEEQSWLREDGRR